MLRSLLVLLLASTALPLVAQDAGGNVTFIDQTGDDNTADIEQSGRNNIAGLEADVMLQDGFFNELNISQTGLRNRIGTLGSGLDQLGRFTSAEVHNTITIIQNSNDNLVGEVDQRALGVVPNGANALFVEQSGGSENQITRIFQLQLAGQARQEMILRQTGQQNIIRLADQTANSVDRNEPNLITVVITGDRNGISRLRGAALIPFLVDSGIIQEAGTADGRGNGNFVDLLITGNDNAFGIRQGGRLNSVGFVTITGDLNDLGVRQDGDENDFSMAILEGNNNIIGADQLGTNMAEVNVIGYSDDNVVSIRQQGTNDAATRIEGHRNAITVDQDFLDGLGGENKARVEMTGDDNAALVTQRGDNSFSLEIEGNGNNTQTGLSAFAMLNGLAAGEYLQSGFDNDFLGEVAGDRNVSAAIQQGDLNSILLIVEGDDNEAAFVQIGSGNRAVVRQTGVLNQAFIRQ